MSIALAKIDQLVRLVLNAFLTSGFAESKLQWNIHIKDAWVEISLQLETSAIKVEPSKIDEALQRSIITDTLVFQLLVSKQN